MSDQEPVGTNDDGPAARPELAAAEITGALRRFRAWLIVLTVLVAVLIAAVVVAAVWVPRAIHEQDQSAFETGMMAPTDDQLASARQQVEHALGSRLQDLDVRVVTMKMDDAAVPAEVADQQFIYLRFGLTDSDVVFADVVGGPFGSDPSSMGMLPTQGSLRSRMTAEQFDRFLVAYARETASPLSNVRRYDDRSEMMQSTSLQSAAVKVGKKRYEASDLWAATEGMEVQGDTVGVDLWSSERTALIFYENPETGDFEFLGTEPALGF